MKNKSNLEKRAVYVIDGCRTPFIKAKNIGSFKASDLAVIIGKTLLARQPLAPSQLDEVILGCAMPEPDEANIARVVALRIGCGEKVPAFTVMRNCASGMQALDNAAIQIASGRSDLILAGGAEAMSHGPILFNHSMVSWLYSWSSAKSYLQKISTLTQFRPSYLAPVIALLRGLTDPIVGLNMGQTAEELAYFFHLTRQQLDEYAMESHCRIENAYQQHRMDEEIVPIVDKNGMLYAKDDGIRGDTTIEKLAQLKPFFDKKFGLVTAGNSSQITDGACLLLLASRDAVEKYHLPVIGRIIDSQWVALNPIHMGLGPVHAATPILRRHHMKPPDIDCWEINEAFSAQMLACLAAWDDDNYCRSHLGLQKSIGAPTKAQLNKDGGAIAIGHPIGASGARIVLHTLLSLKQTNGSRGMAAICIGGGQGGAMYLEHVTEARHA